MTKKAKKLLVGQRELARLLDCSLGKVQHHLNTGTIEYESGTNKLIDPEKAKKRLEEFTRQKSDVEYESGEKRADYQQARTISAMYEARLKKIDYETKAGKLVKADKVKSELFKVARVVRDKILNIPNRISDELAITTDPHEIHLKLTRELTDALQELADYGKQHATEAG